MVGYEGRVSRRRGTDGPAWVETADGDGKWRGRGLDTIAGGSQRNLGLCSGGNTEESHCWH